MALFGRKNKEEVAAPKAVKAPAKAKSAKPVKAEKSASAPAVRATLPAVAPANQNFQTGPINAGSIILGPRITEKATMKADVENVFVFEIAQSANKVSVSRAVRSLFNVQPLRVSIARNPSKKVISRGKVGHVSGIKKAYVYLKKGDKIEII